MTGELKLSAEEIIAAALRSEKKAVKQALEKLEFTLRMSHSQEDLIELTDLPIYHLRLGHKVKGDEYVYTVFRWSGDTFAIFTNTNDANGVINGYGKPIEGDPAIVYLNKPRLREKKIGEKK